MGQDTYDLDLSIDSEDDRVREELVLRLVEELIVRNVRKKACASNKSGLPIRLKLPHINPNPTPTGTISSASCLEDTGPSAHR